MTSEQIDKLIIVLERIAAQLERPYSPLTDAPRYVPMPYPAPMPMPISGCACPINTVCMNTACPRRTFTWSNTSGGVTQ